MNGEYLSLAEIEAKYPNEWVLIDRPKVGRDQSIAGGYVLAHDQSRDEVERVVESLPRPFDIAILQTSWRELADNEVFVL
jgi:hypothetical protein